MVFNLNNIFVVRQLELLIRAFATSLKVEGLTRISLLSIQIVRLILQV